MRDTTHRLRVRAASPEPVVMAQAAVVIGQGGVVAIPTDTVYGLAVDPFNARAVERLFAVKGRPDGRPVALVAADLDQLEADLGALGREARALANRFWPGPLTLLVPARATLAAAVSAGTGRVGVRVPAHDVPRALCRAAGRVLTATSANLSGEPVLADPEELWEALGDRVDLLIDAGPTAGGPPSTVVDTTCVPMQLVRPGAIDWGAITR
jgi:L-threonylcarbamoyladenylate synthase